MNFSFATAPGVSYERANIVKLEPKCRDTDIAPSDVQSHLDDCVRLTVRLTSGPDSNQVATLEAVGPGAHSNLAPGDTIQVMRSPGENPALLPTPSPVSPTTCRLSSLPSYSRW